MLVVNRLPLILTRYLLRLTSDVLHEFHATRVDHIARLVGDSHLWNDFFDDLIDSFLRESDLIVLVHTCRRNLEMVLLHELRQHIILLLLIRRRQSHLLLPLIIHHFLDHRTRLSIQIAQLRVLRLHFFRVDWRIRVEESIPPLHIVDLLQCEHNRLSVLDNPIAVLHFNGVREFAIDNGRLVLETDGDAGLLDFDDDIAGFDSETGVYWDANLQLLKCLSPLVHGEIGSISTVRFDKVTVFLLSVFFHFLFRGRFDGGLFRLFLLEFRRFFISNLHNFRRITELFLFLGFLSRTLLR
ncbi:hypothetical protein GCK72_008367 [Caenorhabditis remanei]|uniref:Uncharacterized protein n=1 Tax=Caenorhabditis remanei TaxID=31234 RepID=A0A6A5GZH9_CAERE|nr:hypothetical protein GCK72_008367 [Caenorhabditis remanei]KAF1760121.1 hypothetical protein GCK72_008367 [Caenorhabditis remanei]